MNDTQELANIAGMTASAIESGKLVWVVRCKDCKHARRMCQPWNDLVCEKNGQVNKPDWFCADGERKEGR